MTNRRAATTKIVILLGLLLGVAFIFQSTPMALWLDRDRLLALLGGLRRSAWGPVVFILLYAGMCAIAFPGTIMTFLGGVLFGTGQGTLYNVLGATLGASLAYGLARLLGRDFVELFIRKGKMAALDDQVGENGFKIILMLRVIPIFPFTGINFSAGLSKVKFLDFVSGTLIGMIPVTFIYTYFAETLSRGKDTSGPMMVANLMAAGALLVALVMIPYIYNKMKNDISAPPPPES